MMAPALIGRKFGSLKVIAHGDEWKCQCDCGRKIAVRGKSLREGRARSCIKCLLASGINYRHGGSKTRLYNTWAKMRDRCNNPRSAKYRLYGGRGISVCKPWDSSFEAFRDWAHSHGYAENLTIDRINPDRGYTPKNCRWVTRAENNRNTRRLRQKKKGGAE